MHLVTIELGKDKIKANARVARRLDPGFLHAQGREGPGTLRITQA